MTKLNSGNVEITRDGVAYKGEYVIEQGIPPAEAPLLTR
jgi:hypothetical protein